MWLRITLLAVVALWGSYVGLRHEKAILRRLTKAARGSSRRALLVISGLHLGLVVLLALCVVVAVGAYRAGLPALTLLTLVVWLAAAAPFLFVLAPSNHYGGGGASSFGDLRKLGAPRNVARAIAYPAIVYYFVPLMPAVISVGICVVVIE